jgi:hypothetical protein
VRRHASAEELASYAAGVLRPRKAAKIGAHLAGCARCTQVSAELESVSATLASVSFAPMPENLSVRIEAAIATEASHRVASAPATETGRRDLPAQAGGGGRSGWKLPKFNSPLAVRLAAAAAAAVVVVGGAYELASHGLGSSSSGAPSSAAGHAPSNESLSYGSQIDVGAAGHQRTEQTVSSNTDFEPASMQTQVDTAMTQAKKDHVPMAYSGAASAPAVSANSTFAPAEAAPAYGLINPPNQKAQAHQLEGCVNRISRGVLPALVELAKFEGKKATIIILAARGSSPPQVWVVGAGCSASASEVLYHQTLRHI